jgi:hypothetical protein
VENIVDHGTIGPRTFFYAGRKKKGKEEKWGKKEKKGKKEK